MLLILRPTDNRLNIYKFPGAAVEVEEMVMEGAAVMEGAEVMERAEEMEEVEEVTEVVVEKDTSLCAGHSRHSRSQRYKGG